MDRIFLSIGSLMAAIAIAAGAYGAHAGLAFEADQMRWIAKAARYQMYHSLALVCISLAMSHWPAMVKLLNITGWLFLLGILFFSGSLYLMAFTGINLSYFTPIGGVSFIAGWALMTVAGVLKKK